VLKWEPKKAFFFKKNENILGGSLKTEKGVYICRNIFCPIKFHLFHKKKEKFYESNFYFVGNRRNCVDELSGKQAERN
jgi:hypothetical protein